MIGKTLGALLLLTGAMGLPQAGVLGAEALPTRALARIGGQRCYHGPGVGCAALSPNGRRIASAANYDDGESDYVADKDQEDYNRIIVVWDAVNGDRLRELRVPRGGVSFLAFSPDGKMLLLVLSPTLRLFDTTTGKERFPANHLSPVTPRFSADGRTLFTSCVARRCRWDVSGKQPVLLAEEPRNTWDCGLAYSVEDRLFLDVHEQQLRLCETATGRVRRTLQGTPASTNTSDFPLFGLFAPDTARVLFGNNRNNLANFWIYDVKTGKALAQIKDENSSGEPVFSPDDRQVAWTDRDGSIHLYDARTGKAVRTLRSTKPLPEQELSHPYLCFSPDGARLIVAGHIPTDNFSYHQMPTRVFQVSRGRELLRFYANPEKSNNAAEISQMVCSPDGRLVAVAEKFSGTIRLIELASGKVRGVLAGHRHGIQGLAFAPDGKTLSSGGKDPFVFLWDVTGANTLATTAANLAEGWRGLASDDGKRAGNAIAFFLRKPEASVAFLREKLHPEETISEKRLAQLLANLDADAFETRETASRDLVRLGERAEAALRRELTNRPSLEMRRRIEDILSKLEPSPPPLETLRALRAIEVLEHLGTPAARHCLEALAKGAADARQTREAKAALRRLAKRRG